jgi:cell division protein FtsB
MVTLCCEAYLIKSFVARFAYAAVALLVAAYAFFALRGPQGIPGLLEKRRQIEELERRNTILAREIERKSARISRLRENQSDQDLEIRQRLKLLRPEEKVFILQDQEKK